MTQFQRSQFKLASLSSRRRFLKQGLGTLGASLFAPYLGALNSRFALADSASIIPPRIVFLYVPCGIHMPDWLPGDEGELRELPPTLSALEPFRRYLSVCTGFDNRMADPKGSEFGEHARAAGSHLTGVHPLKTSDVNMISSGVSCDVIMGRHFANQSLIPALHLGTELSTVSDAGYAELYNNCLSWEDEATPLQPLIVPEQIYNHVFGSLNSVGNAGGFTRDEQSLRLMGVLQEASQLTAESGPGQLPADDQLALGAYEDTVQLLRDRLGSDPSEFVPEMCRTLSANEFDLVNLDYEGQLRSTFELISQALSCRLTNVVTFMMASEISSRSYEFLSNYENDDMSGGHHDLSHHKSDPENLRKLAAINRFHIRQLAYFLELLEQTPEGDGNMLDHTFIVYGCSIADGNTHSHQNIPILCIGKGLGLQEPGDYGMHVNLSGAPISNLWTTIMSNAGIRDSQGLPITSFGDSTGKVVFPRG